MRRRKPPLALLAEHQVRPGRRPRGPPERRCSQDVRCPRSTDRLETSRVSTATDKVSFRVDGLVGRVPIDDGYANVCEEAFVAGLTSALDRAEEQRVAALLIEGRPGVFSAGWDQRLLTGLDAFARRTFFRDYLHVILRLLQFPRPVVAAVTGHALGAGATLALCCDVRFGARGPFQLGFREVAMGMTPPGFALEIARLQLSPEALARCLLLGELVAPEEALRLGFVTRLYSAEEIVRQALDEANWLTRLPEPAFANTKRALRVGAVAGAMARAESDADAFFRDIPYESAAEQAVPPFERREHGR
jgi:enoyl-CoA hydratase